METRTSQTSPTGQKVEYRQYPSNGVSLAESRAKVFVSGKCVASGWSSDGVTYAAYAKIVTGCTSGDGPCPNACQCGCNEGEFVCGCQS